MSLAINITDQEIIHQLKISGKIHEFAEQVATRKIIEREASLMNLAATKEELQELSDRFRITNKLTHAKHTLEWLEKNRLSLDEFEETLRVNLLKTKLIRRLFIDEIESYFYQNQSDYRKVVLYEVIIDSKDLAVELFYSIREEELTFSEMARSYSIDMETRRRGGYSGIINSKDMQASIRAAVFACSPPQLIKPIITSIGSHLLFVEEIIIPELDDELGDIIAENLFTSWMKAKIQEATTSLDL
jgi:parvulin-like peptidyl-prolyl isomerase